jgi:hypothetical protein
MMGGSRELAEASKLVNPRDISDKGVAFLSVFQNQNGKLLLMLIGMQSPVVVDRDEMYRSNVEKIKWGIDSGRLQKASKGVSKLSIDGVPCLLQDIETQVGARMLTYEFFIPGASKGVFSVCIACDDNPTYIANTRDIETIIKSIRVISK